MPAYSDTEGSGYGAAVQYRSNGAAWAAERGGVAALVRSVTERPTHSLRPIPARCGIGWPIVLQFAPHLAKAGSPPHPRHQDFSGIPGGGPDGSGRRRCCRRQPHASAISQVGVATYVPSRGERAPRRDFQRRTAPSSALSISCNVAASSTTPTAPTLSSICSGEVAPIIAELTTSSLSTQASAI